MSFNFSRKMFGGTPDVFCMSLIYQAGQQPSPSIQQQLWRRHSPSLESHAEEPATCSLIPGGSTVVVDWKDEDPEREVLGRLKDVQRTVLSIACKEVVKLRLEVIPRQNGEAAPTQIVSASSFGKDVIAWLEVETLVPNLRGIQASRVSGSGVASASLVRSMLGLCPLEHVAAVVCCEGVSTIWLEALDRWRVLARLDLGGCGLSTLPPEVGSLATLQELLISNNRLMALPKEIGRLTSLQVLIADDNQLAGLPGELRHCTSLVHLSLEANKLVTPVLDLRALKSLKVLRLHGNPLEFLPELSPAHNLRHLTLANVRITADEDMTTTEVSVTGAGSNVSRNSKLVLPLFQLLFRRSSCQHPILASAIATLAEGPYCSVITQDPGAVRQVILMALSDNTMVVREACRTLALLASSEGTAAKLLDNDVLQAMQSLIGNADPKIQVSSLRVLSSLAFSSEGAAQRVMSDDLLESLQGLMASEEREVQALAMETLGNLAYCRANRPMIVNTPGILKLLAGVASRHQTTRPRLRWQGFRCDPVGDGALRALAILGENELVRRCLGRPSLGARRGLRILTLDGGGMRGIVAVRMIKELEARTGHSVYDMFDLIGGTSTGGILAIALGVKDYNMTQLDAIYSDLGKKVFSRPSQSSTEDALSWRESLYSVYNSSMRGMRVAMYGTKHDAAAFEILLKEDCDMTKLGTLSNDLIDTVSLGGPKVFVVSTLVSVTPAQPFIFRNYEYPANGLRDGSARQGHEYGSSKHETAVRGYQVWQAIRASSAAPYYLDDFAIGNDRWQDGAVSANNPAMQAIREARALWPDTPIDCVVSLGAGAVPVVRRPKSMSSYLDTGNVLIESACSIERVDESLATLAPMIPGLKYFRFNPVDDANNMELDCIDQAEHDKCLQATEKYIEQNQLKFEEAATALLTGLEGMECRVEHEGLGSAKGLMVVECPQSIESAVLEASHLEAVADVCSSQPLFLKRFYLKAHDVSAGEEQQEMTSPRSPRPGPYGRRRTGSRSAAPSAEVLGLLRCVQQYSGQVGVVHLALSGSPAGPVTRWAHQVVALAEPSPEADKLREALGAPNSATLQQALGSRPSLEMDGGTLTLVSHQTQQVLGSTIGSYLFRRTIPAAHLTTGAIASSQVIWRGHLVVLSCEVQHAVVEALLEAHAKAVLVPSEDLRCREIPATADFFRAFYKALYTGHTLLRSLRLAEGAVPSFKDLFSLFHIQHGTLSRADSIVEGRI